jgi:hypothetical protein
MQVTHIAKNSIYPKQLTMTESQSTPAYSHKMPFLQSAQAERHFEKSQIQGTRSVRSCNGQEQSETMES